MNEKVFCEHCDERTNYYKNTEEVTRKVKDLDITLKVQVPRCLKCEKEVSALDVDSEVQQMFFNEYRTTKGLILVDEIIESRNILGISQRDLARLVGLGEITISRYELGSIPTKSSSMIIQSLKERNNVSSLLKSNSEKISKKGLKAIQLYLDKTDPVKYTGNRQYSKEKFSQLTAFLIELFNKNDEKVFVTKLNKLLFYIDFNYFKKIGISITGSKYQKLSYGPVPKSYSFKYDMNPYLSTISTDESVNYILNEKVKYDMLDSAEMIIAEAVYNYFIDKNGKYISNASHEEDAWLKTEEGEDISYEMSNTLKITV